MDIYIEQTTCPICNTELAVSTKESSNFFMISENMKICKNGCFSCTNYTDHAIVFVFNDKYAFLEDFSLQMLLDKYKYVQKKIDYWKENDRYLAEILEGQAYD